MGITARDSSHISYLLRQHSREAPWQLWLLANQVSDMLVAASAIRSVSRSGW